MLWQALFVWVCLTRSALGELPYIGLVAVVSLGTTGLGYVGGCGLQCSEKFS